MHTVPENDCLPGQAQDYPMGDGCLGEKGLHPNEKTGEGRLYREQDTNLGWFNPHH